DTKMVIPEEGSVSLDDLPLPEEAVSDEEPLFEEVAAPPIGNAGPPPPAVGPQPQQSARAEAPSGASQEESGSGSRPMPPSGSAPASPSSAPVSEPTPRSEPPPLPAPERIEAYRLSRDACFQPVPRTFSVAAALTYGWEIMRANFPLFLGATLTSMLLSAACLGFSAPFLAAMLAYLSLQAARGGRPGLGDGFRFLGEFPRLLAPVLLWTVIVLACQIPIAVAVGLASLTGSGPLQFAVVGISVLLQTWFMVRLGWAPFVLADHPASGALELFQVSLAISKGHTIPLLILSLLTYCAVIGTALGLGVGLVLMGAPIVLGVGGGTYVLLDRELRQAVDARSA
ncbi:MAG: hypothetical protein N2C14_19390, partial [Planctomycetales bacterium]